jgi:hypothetical protein
MKEFDRILQKVQPLQEKLLNHSVFNEIESLDDLNTFLEHHVYFVWDEMSILKALQRDLTCTSIPWIPKKNPNTRRYVNELVLERESGNKVSETVQSEYELFLEVMRTSNADPSGIERLVVLLSRGENINILLDQLDIPKAARAYLEFSYKTIEAKDDHKVLATYVFGKQTLISEKFLKTLDALNNKFPVDLTLQLQYFEPKVVKETGREEENVKRIFEEICGSDAEKWDDVAEFADQALQKRINLLDDIKDTILSQRNMATAV